MTNRSFDDATEIVALTGELDLTNVGALRRRVQAALSNGRPYLVIDLAEVTHMDSTGLAELIAAHQRAAEVRGGLVLVVTSPAIRRTLEIRGVSNLFTLVETADEARAVLRSRANLG